MRGPRPAEIPKVGQDGLIGRIEAPARGGSYSELFGQSSRSAGPEPAPHDEVTVTTLRGEYRYRVVSTRPVGLQRSLSSLARSLRVP
jgi:hypothetical protein